MWNWDNYCPQGPRYAYNIFFPFKGEEGRGSVI